MQLSTIPNALEERTVNLHADRAICYSGQSVNQSIGTFTASPEE